MLDLKRIMKSEFHWLDPNVVNPCTEVFVDYCIDNFPAEATMSGVAGVAHFYSWVNEQAHPYIIPLELVAQMWDLR